MPLQTACSACSAKIKVKDELVGKSIKCPKCGKVFKGLAQEAENAVKAGAAASTNGVAPKPEPKKPPPPAWDDNEEEGEKKPAWDKKSKDDDEDEDDDDAKAKKPAKTRPPSKKRAEDDDDDDDEPEKHGEAFAELLEQTTVSPQTKKQIMAEIGLREKALWIGQPDRKILIVRAIPKAIAVTFVLAIFAFALSVIAGTALAPQGNPGIAAAAIGGVVLLWFLGSAAISGLILFVARRRAIGTAYVITNKRCITFLPGLFSGTSPTSYYPDLVQHMRPMASWIFGGNAGDIVFRSVTTITTTYHQRGGSSRSVSTRYFGFLGVRNMDEIAGRIREALLSVDDDDDDDDDDRRKKKKKKKKKRRDDDDD